MDCAVIDIGSNTVILGVYDLQDDNIRYLFGNEQVVGLINYIEDRELSEKGINALKNALYTIKNILDRIKPKKLTAFATASLRNITNANYVVKRIMEETGICIDIFSQEREAYLGFRGVMLDCPYDEGITVDIGGGSTEISVFREKAIINTINISNGCLSLFNKYVNGLFPSLDEIDNIKRAIGAELNTGVSLHGVKMLVGIGGSIRAVGKLINEIFDTESSTYFAVSYLKALYESFIADDKGVLRAVLRRAPERVHTVMTGMVVLMYICEVFKVEAVYISQTALREGALIDDLR